jgi:hypothetical protein
LRAAQLALAAQFTYLEVQEEETGPISRDSPGGPSDEILVQFLKTKPVGVLTFDAGFLVRTLKEKYGIE